MGKNNPKKKEVIKIVYYLICPKCNKEVSGSTPREVEWNFDAHLKSHKKDS